MLPASATPAARRSTPWREQFRQAAAGELNPVFVKEMRQAVRGRLVATWMLMTGDADRSGFGAQFFATMVGTLTVLTAICVPAWSGGRMIQERHTEEGIDMLYYTPMSSEEIIQGKFLSNVTLAAVFFSAGAPFFAVAPLMRGVDVPTVALVTGLMFFTVVMISQAGLVLASLPVNRVWKNVIGLMVGLFSAPFVLGWGGYCISFIFSESRSGLNLVLFFASVIVFGLLGLNVLIVMAASNIAPRNGIYFRRDRPPRLWTPPMRPEPPPPPLPGAESPAANPRR
jgi:hypothetical protein